MLQLCHEDSAPQSFQMSTDTAVWSRNEKSTCLQGKIILTLFYHKYDIFWFHINIKVHCWYIRVSRGYWWWLLLVFSGFQWVFIGFQYLWVVFSTIFRGFCREYQCRSYIYEFLVVLGPHALCLITNKGLLVAVSGFQRFLVNSSSFSVVYWCSRGTSHHI